MSAFQSRISRVMVRRFSSVGSSSPSWMSSTCVVMPRISSGLLRLGGPPARERTAGLAPVADVAVGDRDELDLVAERRPLGGGAGDPELAVVGMRAECDDPERCGLSC